MNNGALLIRASNYMREKDTVHKFQGCFVVVIMYRLLSGNVSQCADLFVLAIEYINELFQTRHPRHGRVQIVSVAESNGAFSLAVIGTMKIGRAHV